MKTKDKVLELLTSIKGEYLSGQEIADQIFVTRGAVWKAIGALRKEGYPIDAVTNRGYRLKYVPDVIDEKFIQDALSSDGLAHQVFYYDEVGSTNDEALRLAKSSSSPVVVIAGSQTNGRGRRGRQFYSPSNTGLYMSIAYHASFGFSDFADVTALAAVAAAGSIDEIVFDGKCVTKIKWVNDIFLHDLKIAGILTEARSSLEDPEDAYVVIGIGINVYMPDENFPKELRKVAGAIYTNGREYDGKIRSKIAASIIKKLDLYLKGDLAVKLDCLDLYRSKSFLIGNYIRINAFAGGRDYAQVLGITPDYHLLVRYDDGSEGELSTGEVSVVKY